MINHECKIIELGHGDVCVGRNYCGLHFQNIKPPQEIGTYIFRGQEDLNFVGDIIELHITDIKEISEFENNPEEIISYFPNRSFSGSCRINTSRQQRISYKHI